MSEFKTRIKSTSIDYDKRQITLVVRDLPRVKIVAYDISLPVGKGSRFRCNFVSKAWGFADVRAGRDFVKRNSVEVSNYLFTLASTAFGNHSLHVNSEPKVTLND